MGLSIDGCYAAADGSIEWLTSIPNESKSDYGFAEFLDSIDCILMGRKTFEVVKSFDPWPYSKKVFVLSNSISEIPTCLDDKVEIIQGCIDNVIISFKEKEYKSIYVDGGQLIKSFMAKDMIDEMILSTVPIVLGSGKKLFDEPVGFQQYRLLAHEVFPNGIIKAKYQKFPATNL